MAHFGPWDYTILAVVLLISAGIGVYYRLTGGKQKTTREYLLADRSMPILPVAFSLMASFMSAVTLLGVSMENYQYGTQFVVINLSYVLGTPIAAYLIMPVFYRLKTASVYEYLEQRFGYVTRLFASLAFSMQMILYMGIVLYAPALALEAVTGLNIVFSIIIIGVVCTFYATIGGMKAVLVTDIFQSLLMFASVFSIIICAGIKAGGLGDIWSTAREGGRIEFFNFSVDPTTRHTVFTQLIGGMATFLTIYGVNQTQVQRLMAVKSLKASAASLWWSLPILILLSVTTCFSGLCMYYFYKTCDPLLEGRITSRDQLMPLFVVDTMGHIPGLSGLFVSGIFSASLSTISSAISSLSAVTLEDYIKPLVAFRKRPELSDAKTTFYSKMLSIIYGGVCLGLAFLAGSMGGVLQASLSIFGIIGGPLLGLFTLGMYIRLANQKGALTGLILSFAFSFWMGFGQPKPPVPSLPLDTSGCPASTTPTSNIVELFISSLPRDNDETHYFYLYRISYMWYAVLGFLISFLGGLVFSWIYDKLKWDSNYKIYVDTSRTLIRHELFVPPIAKRIRQQQMPLVVVTATSSEIDGNISRTPSFVDDEQDGPTNLTKSYTNSTELNELEVEAATNEDNTKENNKAVKSSDVTGNAVSGRGSMDVIPEERESQTKNGSIQSGQRYSKDDVIRALLNAISPQIFLPLYWRTEKNCVAFFLDDFNMALRIMQLERSVQMSDGYRLLIRVRASCPIVSVDEEFKEKMKLAMAKRYSAHTKALDLTKFHEDPDFRNMFVGLFRTPVMSAALDIIQKNIPDLQALNLNYNYLNSMESFKNIEQRLPNLTILYLAGNNIPSLAHLMVLRNAPIVDLVLKNNPLRQRYKDHGLYVSEVRRKFPKLVKLDGEELEPQILFDINDSSTLPKAQASFLCDASGEGRDIIRQFLEQYFMIFDSDNRQPLLDAYHEQAMLSISVPPASQAGRLQSFWKYNRNFRRIVNNEDTTKIRQLKVGRLPVVSTLAEWPKTQHDPQSFSVDLTLFTSKLISFTVAGLFKEFESSNSNSGDIRYFQRQFVIVPAGGGFCIRNELILITSANAAQTRTFLKPPPSVIVPPPDVGNANMPSTSAGSLQNRLQMNQPTTSAAALMAPYNAVSTQPDDATKMQMVQAMSAQSNMNIEWSRKCLEETNWDYNHAAFVFDKLQKESKIPPEAFIK